MSHCHSAAAEDRQPQLAGLRPQRRLSWLPHHHESSYQLLSSSSLSLLFLSPTHCYPRRSIKMRSLSFWTPYCTRLRDLIIKYEKYSSQRFACPAASAPSPFVLLEHDLLPLFAQLLRKARACPLPLPPLRGHPLCHSALNAHVKVQKTVNWLRIRRISRVHYVYLIMHISLTLFSNSCIFDLCTKHLCPSPSPLQLPPLALNYLFISFQLRIIENILNDRNYRTLKFILC